MARWYTSDQHFDHQNIIAFCNRPFKNVEEMNVELIARWNSVVSDDDEVYVLGDFAMGHRAVSVPYAQLLKGKKILVPGNHDNVWNGRSETQQKRWRSVYTQAGFSIVDGTVDIIVGKQWALASHFPYNDIPRHEGKFDTGLWHPTDDGSTWLLHGHVHQAWKVDNDGRQINVGVDVWDYYPVHEDTIAEIMQ